MNGDLLGNGDVEGDDLMGAEADILGAVRAVLRRRGGGRALGARRVFSKPPLAPMPGQPDAKLRSYMGMGTLSWTGAADTLDKTATVEPQESFRGERLVISVSVTGGADLGVAQLRQITVGTLPQSPSVEQVAPVTMFSPDATYSGLDLQVAHRGMKLAVTIASSASPGAGVTRAVNIGFYGEWIR